MAKLFYLTLRNGVFQVRYVNPQTGKMTCAMSTGCRDKASAEQYAEDHYPQQFNQIRQKTFEQSFEHMTFEEVQKVIEVFKNKGFIESVQFCNDFTIKSFVDYLKDFWDWETSPYINDKRVGGLTIHKYYCTRNIANVDYHYKDFFQERKINTITLRDMKSFRDYLLKKNLSGARVNNILKSSEPALRWAYFEHDTDINAFDGMMYCASKPKERLILTHEQAELLFNEEWPNYQSYIANLLAYKTGMRQGEIKALRPCDIGADRINIKHSYNSIDGLKETKNNDSRSVPLPPQLRKILINYCKGLEEDDYIFHLVKDTKTPVTGRDWLMDLKKMLLKINTPYGEKYTFHAWRHLYITTLSNSLDQRKVQQASGHKTEAMVEHYANHRQEEVFQELYKTVMKDFEK